MHSDALISAVEHVCQLTELPGEMQCPVGGTARTSGTEPILHGHLMLGILLGNGAGRPARNRDPLGYC